jgi:hypothetical protein
MKELLIPSAEALPIGRDSRRRNGRVAVARMMVEDRRPSCLNITSCCVKAVVLALLLHRLVVQSGRRWRSIYRLRMRASDQAGSKKKGCK